MDECLAKILGTINLINTTIDDLCDDAAPGEQGAAECPNQVIELVLYYETVVREGLCPDMTWMECLDDRAQGLVAIVENLIDETCNDEPSWTTGADECVQMIFDVVDREIDELCGGPWSLLSCVTFVLETIHDALDDLPPIECADDPNACDLDDIPCANNPVACIPSCPPEAGIACPLVGYAAGCALNPLACLPIGVPCVGNPLACVPISASADPPAIQVWSVNLRKQELAWRGFVQRVATGKAPDIVLVQEVLRDQPGDKDLSGLLSALNAATSANYVGLHSGEGNNAVIWKSTRFLLHQEDPLIWDQSEGQCPGDGKTAIAAVLKDRADLLGRTTVAASVHFKTNLTKECLDDAVEDTNAIIDGYETQRDVTIIGGDFNLRADMSSAQPDRGLEAHPECWYLNMRAGDDPSCNGSLNNRYYDTAWLAPGSGGGTNPTSPAFCKQFTFQNPPWAAGDGVTQEAKNSCDLGLGERDRIDYIWVGFEVANGDPWTPPAAAIAPFIHDAGADLGMSLDRSSLAQMYSDHRVVHALFSYPTPPSPERLVSTSASAPVRW